MELNNKLKNTDNCQVDCKTEDKDISSDKGLEEKGMNYSEKLKSFYFALKNAENKKIDQMLESVEANIFDIYKDCLKNPLPSNAISEASSDILNQTPDELLEVFGNNVFKLAKIAR